MKVPFALSWGKQSPMRTAVESITNTITRSDPKPIEIAPIVVFGFFAPIKCNKQPEHCANWATATQLIINRSRPSVWPDVRHHRVWGQSCCLGRPGAMKYKSCKLADPEGANMPNMLKMPQKVTF